MGNPISHSSIGGMEGSNRTQQKSAALRRMMSPTAVVFICPVKTKIMSTTALNPFPFIKENGKERSDDSPMEEQRRVSTNPSNQILVSQRGHARNIPVAR
ncbi:hypothetical protein [Hymenobacter yonginensis]|uniref:Uncharacterized protein n=1 Tax=Hymenobacter yonginensis TaxID=748197 RepID=A0ABY7PU17_9BACT|nr:hypothetical protein [Hymenobacter yonginensis]WBO86092.1 hypothetical protein O9Z63_07505 [Hymenobacter yonginensis]